MAHTAAITPPVVRLKHFPVSFFSMILGLTGLAIAVERAEVLWRWPITVSPYVLGASATLFLLLSGLYVTKIIRWREDVLAEANHPVKLSFFPTFSISLILLSIGLLDVNLTWSKYLWAIGAGLHLAFTVAVLSIWIHHTTFEIHHINPAWFIPVVGNILVPIAGVQHYSPELSWFFFSIGLIFWLVLLSIIFYRVIFHNPLPERLVPTLFILIAPPAVGFLSYVQLVGDIDGFARVLYYVALFFTLLLVAQTSKFVRLKFFLSWWAYSFPAAAMTLATMQMYSLTLVSFFKSLALVMLIALMAIIVLLLVKTFAALTRGEICVPEN
jgi:tellurite resistance protein